jgi:ABC-type transport system involved in multi-copper enzyme maturation permease subunit
MIWLTWRQFRTQAITAVAALAAFAILLAVTESHMSSLYDTSGLTTCHGATCAELANTFLQTLSSGQSFPLLPDGSNTYVILYFLSVVVILVAPAITGIFWGAPLIARELETGTCRLTWNQSITRTRWLTVKLTLTGMAAMAVAEAFSLLQAWWAAPIGKAVGLGGSASIFTEGRFGPFVFPTHGITPLGYAAFGFALGVTVGLLIRRPIPAMAVTLAIFAAVQFITPLWVRPNLLPVTQTTATIKAAQANVNVFRPPTMAVTTAAVPGQPGAWVISSGFVTAAGQPVGTVPAACESAIPTAIPARGSRHPGGSAVLEKCLASNGIRVTESYQPVSNYWPLQWAETGMFLALALALAWYCMWRLNRRRS